MGPAKKAPCESTLIQVPEASLIPQRQHVLELVFPAGVRCLELYFRKGYLGEPDLEHISFTQRSSLEGLNPCEGLIMWAKGTR